MKITVITHYAEEDTDFYGDYYSIEIVDEKGETIYFKGDWYHDNGKEKVEGFIDGLKYILGEDNLEIQKVNKADGVV